MVSNNTDYMISALFILLWGNDMRNDAVVVKFVVLFSNVNIIHTSSIRMMIDSAASEPMDH